MGSNAKGGKGKQTKISSPPLPSAQTKRAAKENQSKKKSLPSSSETDPRKLGPPVSAPTEARDQGKVFSFLQFPFEMQGEALWSLGRRPGRGGALKTFRWRRICCPPLQRMQILYPGGGAFATGKAALRYRTVAFQQSSFFGGPVGCIFLGFARLILKESVKENRIFC